jgi:fimbrial isopeptide formation D2 family protein
VELPKATPAPLTIVKSNDPSDVVKFGDTITYTLTVSMPATGTANHTDVVVTDTLPGYDENHPTSGTVTYVDGSATCVGAPPPGGTCNVTETLAGDTTTGLAWALGTMKPGDTRAVTYAVTADQQAAVVDGSETVDFINVAAVESNEQPTTPSNVVVNTAVLTDVSDNELPHTGSSYPLGRIAMLGLALLMLGATMIRRSAPRPVRVTGKHAAR